MITLYVEEMEDPVQGSRRLLERGLAERGAPLGLLLHDGRGRPWLEEGPQISLSHTRGAAAAALSDRPVGVDLERRRPIRENLALRVMSPAEYRWFRDRGARPADFLVLWTLKESYYKYLGTGLPGFPNETEFYLEEGRWRLRGSELRFWVWEKDLLTVALCGEEQEVRFMGPVQS